MKASRVALPLRFDRRFQLWSYRHSHSYLVLRGWSDDYQEYTDLEFGGVLGMKTVSSYPVLSLTEAGPDEEIDGYPEIPERHADKVMKFRISDGTHDGFVVCRTFVLRHGMVAEE
ncbi:hypothetical protein [Kitasatospora sp. NPDC056181]|uniref:hypothetical protein n=1 Tax=Kitasatospora sp. NPDC056181 TaxID=3345737 RepID=UPI0035DBA1DD